MGPGQATSGGRLGPRASGQEGLEGAHPAPATCVLSSQPLLGLEEA